MNCADDSLSDGFYLVQQIMNIISKISFSLYQISKTVFSYNESLIIDHVLLESFEQRISREILEL